MNGKLQSTKQLIEHLKSAELDADTEIVIAPPLLHLMQVKDLLAGSKHQDIKVSAQNAYHVPSGAFTGGERARGFLSDY